MLAVIAGTESAIRKIATPASSARTVTEAITAAFEKIRSPGRRLPPLAEARIWPAWVVVSGWASISLGWRRFGGPAPFQAGAPSPRLPLDQPPIASMAGVSSFLMPGGIGAEPAFCAATCWPSSLTM